LDRVHLHCLDAADISFLNREDSQPQKHGDFTEWAFWRDEFLWPDHNSQMPARLGSPKPSEPILATKY
jgi:hypothetical protein